MSSPGGMVELVTGLEEQEYYHGFIRREEAEYILQKTGDYLVRCELERGLQSNVQTRLTSTICKYILCVSVEMTGDKTENTVAEWKLTKTEKEEKWRVGEDDKNLFDTIPLLIEAYSNPDRNLELPPVTVVKFLKSGRIPWAEQLGDKQPLPPTTIIEKVQLKKCVKKPKWQLNPADVIMSTEPENLLGSGNYGYVQRGQLNQNGTKIDVAIKVVEDKEALANRKSQMGKLNANTILKKIFLFPMGAAAPFKKSRSKKSLYSLMADTLKEAAAMRDLFHPNVVKMYGVVVDKSPIMMVLELVNKGSLKSYMTARLEEKRMDETEMHNLAIQAAWGLEYLHSKLVIHRDIAARNCLLHKEDNEQLTLKISDFGLSKIGTDYHVTKNCGSIDLPVKTMAPESILNYAFNSTTDVWSFGFLLYEIYTHGKQPLPEWKRSRLVEHYNVNDKKDCPQELPDDPNFSEVGKTLMRGCWKYTPAERLTISDICCTLEKTTDLKPPVELSLRKQNEAKKEMIQSMMPKTVLAKPKPKEPATPNEEQTTMTKGDEVTKTKASKEDDKKPIDETKKPSKENGKKATMRAKKLKEKKTTEEATKTKMSKEDDKKPTEDNKKPSKEGGKTKRVPASKNAKKKKGGMSKEGGKKRAARAAADKSREVSTVREATSKDKDSKKKSPMTSRRAAQCS